MTVAEIKTKVAELPGLELADFARWFEKFQADAGHQHTAQKESLRLGRTRLASECAKLNSKEEQALAEEGMVRSSRAARL